MHHTPSSGISTARPPVPVYPLLDGPHRAARRGRAGLRFVLVLVACILAAGYFVGAR